MPAVKEACSIALTGPEGLFRHEGSQESSCHSGQDISASRCRHTAVAAAVDVLDRGIRFLSFRAGDCNKGPGIFAGNGAAQSVGSLLDDP